MSLPRRLLGGLRSVRASATALVPALVLTLAACAAVHEGAAGVDAGVDQPAATDAASISDATDDSPRGSVVDSASGDDAPPVDAGEVCTDGGNCLIGCGNGTLDPGLGEVCDDGNSVSGDGCSSNCTTVEKDYACPQPGEPCVYLVKCGDGRLGGKETCDDGNVIDKDGCSATCQKEAGWDCGKPGTACTAHCGDGDPDRGRAVRAAQPRQGLFRGLQDRAGVRLRSPARDARSHQAGDLPQDDLRRRHEGGRGGLRRSQRHRRGRMRGHLHAGAGLQHRCLRVEVRRRIEAGPRGVRRRQRERRRRLQQGLHAGDGLRVRRLVERAARAAEPARSPIATSSASRREARPGTPISKASGATTSRRCWSSRCWARTASRSWTGAA